MFAVLALVAILAGCSAQQSALDKDTMAVVNGRAISRDDFNLRLKTFELFFKKSMDDTAAKQQVLDQMVQEKLLSDEANAAGIKVTDEQVESEMGRFMGALDRQYTSRDAVNQKLQQLGLTNDNLASFLKTYLLNQAIVDQKKAAVQLTDDEMHAFYNEKKDTLYTYKTDVVRAAHILVPADQEAKADEIAAKAKNGGDFAQLAKLYSIDPETAQLGGDIGYFTHDGMVKEFADAAFAMAPGRTSDPVKTQYGWHIILVEDKQGPGVLPYEKAQDDIKNRLLPAKQDKAYQAWLDGLMKNAKISKADLTKDAK
jgi:foldase protein PrsA